MELDLAINGGTVFDGSGAAGRLASVGIRGGRVVEISDAPLTAREVIDARGQWVMPGFVDVHTHYDAEVEAAPALLESLRHGVTTVVVGSCSLGTALSSPLDIADMFTRVEAIPREHVLPLFERVKTWQTPAEYRAHLDALPLGPNVAAFLGHSDLRVAVMGLDRAVDPDVRPTDDESARMDALLRDALAAGYLGLSANTNRWDKLGGSRHRSKPLPSTFARWRELRRLCKPLREAGRVLQAIPNISAKYDVFLFAAESIGLGRRPALKTSLVSLADVRSNRAIWRGLAAIVRTVNRVLGGAVRFQSLPMPFELFVEGLDAPVFEELMAGTAVLHIEDPAERAKLLRDPTWRAWFRKQWTSVIAPKVFHRDLSVSKVVACPDASLVGRSFTEFAEARGTDVVDTFLDLCAEHGDALRWFTMVANDRPAVLDKIVALDEVMIGFSDAGAHLRNMAFYNFGLHLLRMAKRGGTISVERAVHRLTGELATWLGLDAGAVEVGARADVVVVDPAKLDASLDAYEEAPIAELGGFRRMVRRNDATVPAVIVGGQVAVREGAATAGIGNGRFLAAGETIAPREPLSRGARAIG